jgi:PncC family amidohydrolase
MLPKRCWGFPWQILSGSKAREIIHRLTDQNMTVAAAESCTAGLASDLIARIPGASRVLWGSYVSYTTEAKFRMLGIEEAYLKQFGAVSRETACAMAQGALERSGAGYAFSITGLAGPGGEGELTAGTVWIATVRQGDYPEAVLFHFRGSRNLIRRKAAQKALEQLLKKLASK